MTTVKNDVDNAMQQKGNVSNPLHDTLESGIYTYGQNAPDAPSTLQGIVITVRYYVWAFALAIDFSGKLYTAITATDAGQWGTWTEK